MGGKGRLLLSLVSICIALSLISIGAYCALSVTYTVSGSVNYEIQYDIIPNLIFSINQSAKTATVTGYTGSPTDVKIPATISVVSIGSENLYIEGNDYIVTSISRNAFADCKTITDVQISEGVKTIGDQAFANSSLKTINIPRSVSSIGDIAFSDCKELTQITVSSSNNYYASDTYGVLFNKSKTTLIQYPTGNTRSEYDIPYGVTNIADYCFFGALIQKITIPNTVTEIGQMLFANCLNLTSISIPNSIKTIGGHAFLGCSSLPSIEIPQFVTSIHSWAFSGCTGLTSINVNSNNAYYSSDENGILYNKNKTILIQYPLGRTNTSFIIPNSVTTIDSVAFRSCQRLQSITISARVTEIGSYAFVECSNLTRAIFLDTDSVWRVGYLMDAKIVNIEEETHESLAELLTSYNEDPQPWTKMS